MGNSKMEACVAAWWAHLVLLLFSLVLFQIRKVPVVFFPKGDPNFIYVYLKLPVGSSVDYTDSITKNIENKVMKVLDGPSGKPNPIVESVISNVAVGASDPLSGNNSTQPNLGRVQVSFVEYQKRHGISTAPYLDSIRECYQRVFPVQKFLLRRKAAGRQLILRLALKFPARILMSLLLPLPL